MAPNAAPEKEAPNAGDVDDDDGFKLFGDDGFTFLDFLDIINPLQHIPIIGTLYREITDDTLDPGSRVLGGTLFLGPVGTVVSLANVLINDATGKDVGEHVMAFFENEEPAAQGAEPAGKKIVADVGSRSDFVQPDQPVQLETSPAFLPTGAPGALDPVSAWARSEVAFRHSNVGRGRLMLEGEIQDIEALPVREKAAAPEPVTTGALAPKASETTAVAAVTPAPGWKGVSPYAPVRSAPAALDGPVAGINALAALRQDLMAGGVKKTAEAVTTILESRQSAALFAASAYGPRLADNETRKTKAAPDTPPFTPPYTPPGAVAPLGGWFSETMLTAHGKYQNSANLIGQERPVAVDMTR